MFYARKMGLAGAGWGGRAGIRQGAGLLVSWSTVCLSLGDGGG